MGCGKNKVWNKLLKAQETLYPLHTQHMHTRAHTHACMHTHTHTHKGSGVIKKRLYETLQTKLKRRGVQSILQ